MEKRKSLIRAVLDIYRNSQAYISVKAQRFGIGRGQWYFFNRLLLVEDGISQEQLSAEMFVDSAHTARALKKLEEDGFVYRQQDPNDARKKNVFITEKAQTIKDEYHQIYKDLNKVFTKGFTPEEAQLVQKLLYRMRDNIADYITMGLTMTDDII
jgi:DNA-binding MarR family transcriptional regulator